MRPARPNIPLPPFPPGIVWIGGPEPVSERVTARGPLLVHFFEVGELSSVRTLPFVAGLHRGFAERGLTVLGVHSPRNDLAGSDAGLEAALGRLDVPYPVANDAQHRIWHAYGCEGWPSTFLWRRGGTLRWAHFGEGAYHETEAEVRAELAPEGGEAPASLLPPAPGGEPPRIERPSEEVFPGGAHDMPWKGAEGEPLEVEYAGAGAWVALSGDGTLEVRVDGEPAPPIDVHCPGLYEIARHERHGIHEVAIWPRGTLRVWSLSFAPGAR